MAIQFPKGKYISMVKVGEKGQIVIPKGARDLFSIQPGDNLLLLADEEKGIALEMDIRSTLEGLTVPAWELCCIIGNLMDNAMDAVGGMQNGRIWLNVREDLRSFYFTVRNNGAPVPEELRQSIFEPGVSTKGEGRGMGLSIVRQTLAEFGGTIALEEGGETAFTVTVPKESRL